MNNRNKNNSIVFLTTLSVYLGLVLVGAPTVLAQSVLTGNSGIQTEIEVRDNKKLSENDFPLLFVEFLNEIKQAVRDGKITLPLPTDFGAAGDFEIVASGIGSGGAVGANVNDARLEEILRDAINKQFYPKAAALADFNKDKSKTIRIYLAADDSDLMLKVSFGKNKAERFAKITNREFSAMAASVKDKTAKQVYENTVATAENNQVSIVTRLPRGSLDELFKQDAKADGK